MAWDDRIQEAAYTSPTGTRLVFAYENVSKELIKKTSEFNFPDVEGSYIQDLGRQGRKYPLRIILNGPDYDIDADTFEEMLFERGVGRLEHPKYGDIDVVPFGSIARRDALKTAANQAIFEVTFFETTGVVYPITEGDAASEVEAAVEEFNEASAEEFDDLSSLDTELEQATFKSDYQVLIDGIKLDLKNQAAFKDKINKRFKAITDSINTGVDLLVNKPTTLALQTQQMIQTPARALGSIKDRLSGFKNLITSAVANIGQGILPGLDSKNSNKFHLEDLKASTAITGSIISCVFNEFEFKSEVEESIDEILEQFETVQEWRDNNFESLGEIDTGAAYQALSNAVAIAAGFLIQISFTVKQERTLVLDRNRNIIELCAELYGEIDEKLDFFINSNNLTGDEILELPRGREVVYYV